MLPPIEDPVLQSNPQFAVLYSTLTTSIINQDGTTKNDFDAADRSRVKDELNKRRLQVAKEQLLTHAISTANPQSLQSKPVSAPPLGRRSRTLSQTAPISDTSTEPAELTPQFAELLTLLPPLLESNNNLFPDSTTLLLSNPPFSDFPTHLPQLANLVSTTLLSAAVQLACIANPSTNPSFVHRTIPNLKHHVSTLVMTVAERKLELTRARLAVVSSLASLFQQQTTVLAQLLRVLEAKHGPIARSLEFRATEAALAAQRQQAEAEIALGMARRDTYTPETAQALANYAAHLRDAKSRLSESIRALLVQLEEFGVVIDDEGDEGRTDKHAEGIEETTTALGGNK